MDSGYNIRTTFIGNKKPTDHFTALSEAAKLRDAYKHPDTSHLVSADAGELSAALVMLALNWYSMRASTLAMNNHNLFAINPQVMLGKTAPVGILEHHALRRLVVEQTVTRLLDELLQQGKSCVQVFVFNGALNSYALCLQKHLNADQLRIYDVDFPGESRDIKLFALGRLGMMRAHPLYDYGKGAANLHSIKCDLSEPKWSEQLFSRKYKFDKSSPSIIIMENSSLVPEEFNALLNALREVMTEESKLLLTFRDSPQEITRNARKFDFLVKGKMLHADLHSLTDQADSADLSDLAPYNFYLLEIAPPSNICRLDEMDLHTIPTLSVSVPQRQDLSLNTQP